MPDDALRNEQLAEVPAAAGFPVQSSRISSIGYFLPKSLGNGMFHKSP
jgi:hypothetical protein